MPEQRSNGENESAIPIFVDDTKYDAPSHEITGQALRQIPTPPVPADRDLWLEVPGPRDDVLIRPEKMYDVKAGSHYYTAPSTINPGENLRCDYPSVT